MDWVCAQVAKVQKRRAVVVEERERPLRLFGCFAASWQHAEVNQKAQIAAAMQDVQ